jgi:hypothetical protein
MDCRIKSGNDEIQTTGAEAQQSSFERIQVSGGMRTRLELADFNIVGRVFGDIWRSQHDERRSALFDDLGQVLAVER